MGESNSLIVIPAGARAEEMINLVAHTGPAMMMLEGDEQAIEDDNNIIQEKKDMHSQNLEKLREMQERRE